MVCHPVSLCLFPVRVRAAKLGMIGVRELLKHSHWLNVGAQRPVYLALGVPPHTYWYLFRPMP